VTFGWIAVLSLISAVLLVVMSVCCDSGFREAGRPPVEKAPFVNNVLRSMPKQLSAWQSLQTTYLCSGASYMFMMIKMAAVFGMTAPEPLGQRDFWKSIGSKWPQPAWGESPLNICTTVTTAEVEMEEAESELAKFWESWKFVRYGGSGDGNGSLPNAQDILREQSECGYDKLSQFGMTVGQSMSCLEPSELIEVVPYFLTKQFV
jgi:hypothetical protein